MTAEMTAVTAAVAVDWPQPTQRVAPAKSGGWRWAHCSDYNDHAIDDT